MRLELGCPVDALDGPFGELADVVVDPIHQRVTHLVVQPHHRHRLARLVPAELAKGDDASSAISIGRTTAELQRMPSVEEFAYVRFGEFPVDDPGWDVGVETILAQPYYDSPGFGAGPMDVDPRSAILYDRIPTGEVEIRRASAVFSADDHHVGHVDGFLVDGGDVITHVVLERGHLFTRRVVAVPIGAVARVATDRVRLRLTRDEVAALPSMA